MRRDTPRQGGCLLYQCFSSLLERFTLAHRHAIQAADPLCQELIRDNGETVHLCLRLSHGATVTNIIAVSPTIDAAVMGIARIMMAPFTALAALILDEAVVISMPPPHLRQLCDRCLEVGERGQEGCLLLLFDSTQVGEEGALGQVGKLDVVVTVLSPTPRWGSLRPLHTP